MIQKEPYRTAPYFSLCLTVKKGKPTINPFRQKISLARPAVCP